ncbi:hypothetical protein ACWEOW_13150 [Monashia sp. NPDC004114]
MKTDDVKTDAWLRDRVQRMRDCLDESGMEPGIVGMLDCVLGPGPIAFATAGDVGAFPRLEAASTQVHLICATPEDATRLRQAAVKGEVLVRTEDGLGISPIEVRAVVAEE